MNFMPAHLGFFDAERAPVRGYLFIGFLKPIEQFLQFFCGARGLRQENNLGLASIFIGKLHDVFQPAYGKGNLTGKLFAPRLQAVEHFLDSLAFFLLRKVHHAFIKELFDLLHGRTVPHLAKWAFLEVFPQDIQILDLGNGPGVGRQVIGQVFLGG